MKLIDLLAQINASVALSDEENPEVIIRMGEGSTEILEVAINHDTDQIEIFVED